MKAYRTIALAAAVALSASFSAVQPAKAIVLEMVPMYLGAAYLGTCIVSALSNGGKETVCAPEKKPVPYVKAPAPFVDQAALAAGRLSIMTDNQLLYRPGYNESRK